MGSEIDPKKTYMVKLAKRVALGAIRLSPIQPQQMSGETLLKIIVEDEKAVAHYDNT